MCVSYVRDDTTGRLIDVVGSAKALITAQRFPCTDVSRRYLCAFVHTMIGSLADRRLFSCSGEGTAPMMDDVLRVAALLVACLLGLWTAVACRRAHYHGMSGSDALVWAGLSAVFFLLALMKTARGLGLLRGLGGFLRDTFKQRGWYEDRRTLQITASIAVAVVVMVLFVWGMMWAWHYIKRYRLAIGFAGLTVGFGIIRFISLHEVDAWNANAPWARTAVDLVAAAGVSAVAIARLRQLRDFARSL